VTLLHCRKQKTKGRRASGGLFVQRRFRKFSAAFAAAMKSSSPEMGTTVDIEVGRPSKST
jgi:hypothetical protein